jgi:hypothetical protein
MNKFLMVACLFVVGCGNSSDEIKHAPIDPVPTPEAPAPILETDLVPKRWIAVDGTDYIMVDLEHKFGTEEDMFHFRLCEGGPCYDYLFFAVGTFKLNPNNQLCFSELTYWNPPPANFFIQDTDPFCGSGVMKDGTMTVVFQTTRGQKTLQFVSQPLEF